jgi:CRP-like cAMP-binding protein
MYENKLLDTLTRSHPDVLLNRLKAIDYVHGDLLAEAGAPIQHVIFPRSGLISMVVDLSDGDRIEVGMTGSGGAIGGGVAFGATHRICTSFAQLPGRAWLMKSADAVEIADESGEFRHLLYMQERYIQAQAQQTAACNAKHTITRRLCSWLLRACDAIGGGELLLTQEHLAQMLGVQRASVSMVASQLREQGLIQYRRGRLHIADRAGLAEHACECHAALRQQREQLLRETVEQPLQMQGVNVTLTV